MRRDLFLVLTIVLGLAAAAFISRLNDQRPGDSGQRFAEDQLYLNGPTMKRLTLSFNAVAADWYWMRSLQYVGGKIVNYEDTHSGRFDLNDLSALDLRLLPSLLRMATTLDPQFLEPYYYGALVLPDLDANEAITLLEHGIAANPNQWRLYQHLGYIYWQRHDYAKASEVYDAGSRLPGAPPWMIAITARMKAEGGSPQAAREMYLHINEVSDDITIRIMVEKQLMRLDSLDDREKIRRVISEYSNRAGHCPASWKDITAGLRANGFRLDPAGAPLDPSSKPYHLAKGGCEVELDEFSQVPPR